MHSGISLVIYAIVLLWLLDAKPWKYTIVFIVVVIIEMIDKVRTNRGGELFLLEVIVSHELWGCDSPTPRFCPFPGKFTCL